jgi:gamma-glutamyltranspeptidase/glutathione hydrolase
MRFSLLCLCTLALPISAQSVAVSVSPPANRVADAILKKGGNAVDASVALGFALAVTWPEAGNIGGGGFMLIRPSGKDAQPIVIDYRETAPAAATATMFADGKRPAYRTVGIPGSVAGLALAHAKFGKLPWADVVNPAVELAQKGFAVDQGLADSLNAGLARAKGFPELQRVFARPEKGKWIPGDKLIQSDLAKTLRRIADKGADDFYKGETAELLLKEMKAGDGLIKAEDLAGYRAKERKPIRGSYRGLEVLGAPPPSSGGVCIVQMLNMLETFEIKKNPRFSVETIHVMAEVSRRVYADRARYLGDADFVKIPEKLITKEHAKKLAEGINISKASKSDDIAEDIKLDDAKMNTTHYSVVDKDGMAISTTTTLEDSFGAKIVVRGAGFLLNNEMTDFNPRPGITTRTGVIGTEPNRIAPGKRMLSSMSPTILVKEGKPILVTGSPGGRTIINTVLNVIVNFVDYEMSIEEAVTAPRYHQQWFPDRIQIEERMEEKSKAIVEELQKRGHTVMKIPRQGDAHSIAWNSAKKAYEGAIDWRRAGRPAPFGK